MTHLLDIQSTLYWYCLDEITLYGAVPLPHDISLPDLDEIALFEEPIEKTLKKP